MHNHEQHTSHGGSRGTVFSYIVGFSLSILLTLAVFAIVYGHLAFKALGYVPNSPNLIYILLIICALLQLFVQLFFFLHVGKESKGHWNLTALAFALIVVSILVGGTLWIMWNLQHINPHGPQEPFLNGEVTPQTEG